MLLWKPPEIDELSEAASGGVVSPAEVEVQVVDLERPPICESGPEGRENPRLSYVSKREGCCELQTGLHPPNDLLSVRKRRKQPHTRSFPGDIHSKFDISV